MSRDSNNYNRTLGEFVKSKKLPKEWTLTFPNGYRVDCRVVSQSYLDKRNKECGGGIKAEALSYTFGEKVLNKLMEDKRGRIYFSSSMTMARFLHVYFHEAHHMFIEWTGDVNEKLITEIDQWQ